MIGGCTTANLTFNNASMIVTCNANHSTIAPTVDGSLIAVGDNNLTFSMNYSVSNFTKFETLLTIVLSNYTPTTV